MFNPRIVLTAVFVAGFAGVAMAQGPASPLDAALRARVAMLEEENARLQADYRVLLTAACPAPLPATALPVQAGPLERPVAAPVPRQTRVAQQEQHRQAREQDDAAWVVSAVESRTTETNEAFVRVAWKVRIKNGIARVQGSDFIVQFLDKDGFVVDTANLYETIAALEERTITGDKQIRTPGGLKVTHIKVVATRDVR